METWQKLLLAVGINLVIIYVIFKVIDFIDRKIKIKIQESDSHSAILNFMPIIIKLLKGLVIFFAVTSFLQSQGYSVSSIIAGFGIGGIAISMEAKDALANIFGSVEVISDKVYKVGDYIKLEGVEGTVEDINIRSTKIRDLDNFVITIPNSVAAKAIVTNISNAKKRYINENFGVTYSTSDEKIQEAIDILKEIAETHKDIHEDCKVYVSNLGDSSINIKFRGYVKHGAFDKLTMIRGEFIQEVVKRFRQAGIDFAFPSQSIYIESDNSKIEN